MADKTILELQQGIIKNCNHLYQKYAEMDVEPLELWNVWWEKSVPAMTQKYIDCDDAVIEFMQYRLQITFRDLQVVKGNMLWPLKR